MPAQISILHLLLTSEPHRNVLLKVLNENHVPIDISIGKLENMVTKVMVTNQITFSEEELTPKGRGHNQALYIRVRCNRKQIPRVLIDNGSALNICSIGTLEKLEISESKIRITPIVVKGYDGEKKETLGEIDLVLEIGPAQYQVPCHVMEIPNV